MGGGPPKTLSPVVFKTPTKNPQIFHISCKKYPWDMTTDPGFVPCPRGNDNIPFLQYWCHHWGSGMKSGAFRGLEANQKKMYLLLTAKAMQGVLLQASPYRGKPPWLFLFSVFLRAASQPVCAGADAKCSSNSHSHILDVCARAHARIKDGGKLWQL